MEGNFSNRVQDVIRLSREEALRLGHDYIGTEHLLLGIIREGEGIAVKILDQLKEGGFARAFREKAAHTELLAQIPIRVVLDEDLPLLGAAAHAAAQLS